MKKSLLNSQCYKLKNFFTQYPMLVHIPYYNWDYHYKLLFQNLLCDVYSKLGGK